VSRADAAFVNEVKTKTAPLEDNWAHAAEARGLKNAKKVLADFRAEISKLEK
jgi:TRAP-type transport system periplasmic protein